jgi:AraC family transcriptional regulator
MTEPTIQTSPQKKLIGMRMLMSFSDNRTIELWQSFMPRRKEIGNAIGTDLYSMQIYKPQFFTNFDPQSTFEKWAAVEVSDLESVPDGIESFIVTDGLYAVFVYRGNANDAEPTFRHIFETWLPNSIYILDDRPHFEILGTKYKKNDPDSEEEIWIPIRIKT